MSGGQPGVATGLDMSTEDFIADNYGFGSAGRDGGVVINRGLIAAGGGSVTMVGSSARHS